MQKLSTKSRCGKSLLNFVTLVAYVEEREEPVDLATLFSRSSQREIYRVKLPGPPNIGEGKPENENHVMSFGLLCGSLSCLQ
ncbi:unnamed protein product [Lactuca virosa]|uniref:Uncharacterized protein n=1 Tax=Lactuca virosa TaxID=75947 RepID=A0AAU9LT15_9ASTR|nr:unnamed protein product [Lactuca virosa]